MVFPPIVERRETVWPQRAGMPPARVSQGVSSQQGSEVQGLDGEDGGAGTSGYDHLAQQQQQEAYDMNDSRSRFLHWVDNTFALDGPEGGSGGAGGPFGIDKDPGKKWVAGKGPAGLCVTGGGGGRQAGGCEAAACAWCSRGVSMAAIPAHPIRIHEPCSVNCWALPGTASCSNWCLHPLGGRAGRSGNRCGTRMETGCPGLRSSQPRL